MEGEVTLVRVVFSLGNSHKELRPSEVHGQCSPQRGKQTFPPQGDLVSPMLSVSRALVKLSRRLPRDKASLVGALPVISWCGQSRPALRVTSVPPWRFCQGTFTDPTVSFCRLSYVAVLMFCFSQLDSLKETLSNLFPVIATLVSVLNIKGKSVA